ncbi:alpha/beta hydrolase, partial [Luedemannella flava]|uniref:alpha/beta hydrolase n=1 Tax=Luedemannella flava TaxID=349316 RepID=UPI0031E45D24
ADLDARTTAALRANLPVTGADGAVDPAGVPAPGTDPRTVRAWWDSLTPAQRRALVTGHPELVGNLDGVPVADRDAANRLVLDRQRDVLTARRRELADREAYILRMLAEGRRDELYPPSLRRDPAGEELARLRAEAGDIDGKLRGTDRITERLANPDPTLPRAYLMGFSTDGDGRAIVAVGNPDEADNVLTYVPGTGADLSKTRGDIDRTDKMVIDATRADPTATTAGILWLGYDAPDTVGEAASSSYARDAVADLDRFTDGLRVTHEGAPSHNVVLGHSYGTTVVGNAAQAGDGLAPDDLVLVASPGLDTNSVADLRGVTADHVWATRADNDLIRRVPDIDLAHGNDPVREDFGARVFTSAPGDPDNEGRVHSAYWDKDNVARLNIARIVTGNYAAVS